MDACGLRDLSGETLEKKACLLPSLVPLPTGPRALTRSVLTPGPGPALPSVIPASDDGSLKLFILRSFLIAKELPR